MFFESNRRHFFRPLNGKYREQVLACLKQLYTRVYSEKADFSRALEREQVIESFQEAITRTPLLDDAPDQISERTPSRNQREQASWILNLLIDNGWLLRQHDEVTLTSRYAFSREGRLFTQPMVEADLQRFRTRHRNTRNTRNALKSFVDSGDELHDLLDAFEYSERIISDFTDVIAELDERKRALVKEVEARLLIRHASEEFFDFMEKRFMPDLSVRLSADSVEKYRDEIQALTQQARLKPRAFKAETERELRRTAPELVAQEEQSLYLKILDTIDRRIQSASEIMLPELRNALHGFTRRADIIIRQLSHAGHQQHNMTLTACNALKSQTEQEQTHLLAEMGQAIGPLSVAIDDPTHLELRNRPQKLTVDGQIEELLKMDDLSRRALFVQQSLEQAFNFTGVSQRDFIVRTMLDTGEIKSHQLDAAVQQDARELLMCAHAIEVGSANRTSSEYQFNVRYSGEDASSHYFTRSDTFTIQLVRKTEHVD